MSNKPASINHRLQVELAALDHCLEQAKNHGLAGEYVTNRDELFRHFVHCTREFTSFIPKYLQSLNIITNDMTEPEIIRQLEQTKIIDQNQHRELLNMLDDQYKAQSEVDEATAQLLIKRTREHFRSMMTISKKIAAALGLSEKGQPQANPQDLP